jgi:hypothetical protein
MVVETDLVAAIVVVKGTANVVVVPGVEVVAVEVIVRVIVQRIRTVFMEALGETSARCRNRCLWVPRHLPQQLVEAVAAPGFEVTFGGRGRRGLFTLRDHDGCRGCRGRGRGCGDHIGGGIRRGGREVIGARVFGCLESGRGGREC